MARQGLFDDSGYQGFEECSRYEECFNEAYMQGRADCLKEAHRFADQESYKEGFKRGIEQGRADKERE